MNSVNTGGGWDTDRRHYEEAERGLRLGAVESCYFEPPTQPQIFTTCALCRSRFTVNLVIIEQAFAFSDGRLYHLWKGQP